ncbi:hypothetical protein ILUMI_08748, partial [Ignelater luminosus]
NRKHWKVVMSYLISGKNYDKAVEDLKERFGREKILIEVYVRDLLKLVIKNAKDTTELIVTSDKCAEILYPVVEPCLPKDILMTWQKNSSYEEDLEKIVEFLKKEVNSKTERALS